MESHTDNPALVVIIGQTASGKSALALELAQRFNGEIICADSRTVYKRMNIGTAKPTLQDRKLVPHHLLNIAQPNNPITAAIFKTKADRAILDINSRGKLPFLVGGSGLYVDAVIFNFQFASQPSLAFRKELSDKSVEELQGILHDNNLALPENAKNPRHLVRQVETGGVSKEHSRLLPNTLVLGLEPLERSVLERRLVMRLEQMMNRGLEREVRDLAAKFGWNCPPLQTIGYQEFEPYFNEEASLQEVENAIVQHSLQYAKRQKTWFKRNKRIHWICNKEEAVDLITSLLNKDYIA